MFTYVVIEHRGWVIQVEEPEPMSYEDMVGVVHGYIEGVYLDGATAYVNEAATALAHAHNAIYGDDWIAGNMLIVGNSDDEGEMTSLTNEWINANLKEIANV
jgi:Domain of unknown function (DUF3846)